MEVITRKLVVLSSVAKGASFLLTGNEVGIGREDDSAICLEDDLVSRHHALLVRKHSEYILRDRNSLNGTFLNGQQVHEAILRVGDRISIGDVELGYESVVVEPSGSSRSQPSKAERVPPEPTTALTALRIRMPAANKSASEPVVEPEVSRQPQLQLPRDLDEIRQATEQLAALSKENRPRTNDRT
jgi:pSer/pThr/pTyr-binding forkhead associated (FHA) protein